jgi:hypothetical protein
MNKKIIGARHGDISFHPISELPKGLKEIAHDGTFILARGEHTGHSHVIASPKINIFQDKEGRYVLEVKQEAKITHQEHNTITLQPGIYIQHQEEERDPFLQQIKAVQD